MNQYQGFFFVEYSFVNIHIEYEINFVKCFGNFHRTVRWVEMLNILAALHVILYCTTGTLQSGNSACYPWKKLPKHVTELNTYSNVNVSKMVHDGKTLGFGNVRLWSEGEKRIGSETSCLSNSLYYSTGRCQCPNNAGFVVFSPLHKYIHPLVYFSYFDQAGFLYSSFNQTSLNTGSPYVLGYNWPRWTPVARDKNAICSQWFDMPVFILIKREA